MARFVKGDVVVVPFPFSNLTQAKRRPALVMSALEGNDAILCQITIKTVRDQYAIGSGGLKQNSNIRPNKVFIADCHIILYRVGHLREGKLAEVIERIIDILNS